MASRSPRCTRLKRSNAMDGLHKFGLHRNNISDNNNSSSSLASEINNGNIFGKDIDNILPSISSPPSESVRYNRSNSNLILPRSPISHISGTPSPSPSPIFSTPRSSINSFSISRSRSHPVSIDQDSNISPIFNSYNINSLNISSVPDSPISNNVSLQVLVSNNDNLDDSLVSQNVDDSLNLSVQDIIQIPPIINYAVPDNSLPRNNTKIVDWIVSDPIVKFAYNYALSLDNNTDFSNISNNTKVLINNKLVEISLNLKRPLNNTEMNLLLDKLIHYIPPVGNDAVANLDLNVIDNNPDNITYKKISKNRPSLKETINSKFALENVREATKLINNVVNSLDIFKDNPDYQDHNNQALLLNIGFGNILRNKDIQYNPSSNKKRTNFISQFKKVVRYQSLGRIKASLNVASNKPPVDPDLVLDILNKLFPSKRNINVDLRSIPIPQNLDFPPPVIPNREFLDSILSKVNISSAAGYDGLTFSVIKSFTKVPIYGEIFSDALIRLLNHFLAGRVPRPLVVGQLTLVSSVKNGKTKIRPICILPSLIRLASTVICDDVNLCASSLDFTQFGMSFGGASVVSIAFQSFMSDPAHIAILLDFVNAFNNISRDLFLEAIKRFLPNFLPYIKSIYGFDIPLMNNQSVNSFRMAEGGCQGDPLMSALFCIALYCALELAGPLPNGVKMTKFIDDASILLSNKDLLDDTIAWLKNFSTVSSNYGLILNREKTVLLARSYIDLPSWDGPNGIWPNASRVNLDLQSHDILGVPFSDNGDLVISSVKDILKTISDDRDRFIEFDDPQCMLLAHRTCLAPRVAFIAGNVLPSLALPVLHDFNSVDKDTIAAFLTMSYEGTNGKMGKFIQLPLSKGGLGLTDYSFYSLIGFLSNVLSAYSLCSYLNATNSRMIIEADYIAQILFNKSLLELKSIVEYALIYENKSSTEKLLMAKPEVLTVTAGLSIAVIANDILKINMNGPVIYPLLPLDKPNDLISFKGCQKFLKAPLLNYITECLYQETSNHNPVVAQELKDSWGAQISSPLCILWKRALPSYSYRTEAKVFRGGLIADYRAPLTASNDSLHCHKCNNVITLDMNKEDIANNGVDHHLRCPKDQLSRSNRHSQVGFLFKNLLNKAGVKTVNMETNVSELLVNNHNIIYDAQLRVDFSFKHNNLVRSYDQSIIHISRGSIIEDKFLHSRNLKNAKYDVLTNNHINFSPIILSTLGAEDQSFKDFKSFVDKIAKSNDKRINWSYFKTKLSVILNYHAGLSIMRCYYD